MRKGSKRAAGKSQEVQLQQKQRTGERRKDEAWDTSARVCGKGFPEEGMIRRHALYTDEGITSPTPSDTVTRKDGSSLFAVIGWRQVAPMNRFRLPPS